MPYRELIPTGRHLRRAALWAAIPTVVAFAIFGLGVLPASAAFTVTRVGAFTNSSIGPVEALSDKVCLVGGNYSTGGFPVGVSYRTANGLPPFTPTQLPDCAFLVDYSFIDSTNGWALGTGWTPALFKTVNGGISWQSLTLGTSSKSSKAIAFSDPLHGWAAGQNGRIIATVDGGAGWTEQRAAVQGAPELTDMVFKDSQKGWAVGEQGLIVHTVNGGTTWAEQTSGFTANLRAVDFLDSSRGVAVGGDGTVLTTANGGTTWTKRSVPSRNGGFVQIDLTDVDWIGSDVFAVGSGGTLASSYDAGATWVDERTMTLTDFLEISFSSPTSAWITAEQGALYRLTRTFPPDTATAYTKRASGFTGQLYAVDFVDTSYGWAAGNSGTILKTTNGGTTWSRIAPALTDDMITGIDFVNRSTGYLTANHLVYPSSSVVPSEFHGYIYKTTNGGATWTQQTHPNDGALVWKVRARDATNAWIAGDQWRIDQVPSPPPPPYSSILRTQDGGGTWARHKDSPPDMMRDFSFPGGDVGFACGYRGWNYKTTNGGTDWIKMTSLTRVDRPMGIAFTSATNGVLVGDVYATTESPGVIARTTDGGTTWTKPALPAAQQLRSAASTGSAIWAVGEGSTILHSGTGGRMWGKQATGTSGVAFWGVSVISVDKVVAVGSLGTILVGRRPSLTMYTPTVPRARYRNRAFPIWGTFKPLHWTGSTKLYVYRYRSGKYRAFKTLYAGNVAASSTTTRYSASFKTPYAGKYYVRAYFTDWDHYPSWSARRYFTVN